MRHDKGIFVLWRNTRQLPEQLPRILPAARVRLIAEPAIDDDAHELKLAPPDEHVVGRLKANGEVQVKWIGFIVSVQDELNAVVIGH